MIDWLMDFFMDKVMPIFILGIMVFIILGVPVVGYGLYRSSQSPTFSLRKDEWACTRSEPRTTTTYVMSGKVMVPITTTTRHCTQWSEQ